MPSFPTPISVIPIRSRGSALTPSCSPPTASSWRCSFFSPGCSYGQALLTSRRKSLFAIACSGWACRSRSPRSRSYQSHITPSRCGSSPISASPRSGGRRSPSVPGQAVRSGSSGCCWLSIFSPACCIGSHPGCSIRSIVCRCAATTGQPNFSCFSSASPRWSIFRRASTSGRAAGSSSGRSTFRSAASCYMRPISLSEPASAQRISIAAF